jgi:phospholipid/cholesterol/gamma-HCH transport system permease protein
MNGTNTGWISRNLQGLGSIGLMAREVVTSLLHDRFSTRNLIYQLYFIGVRSQSVVLITGAFTGMVLAAQSYFQFHRVRMDSAILAVVGVSMCSELGPVLTGLMVAGRVGAALAAELGTMRVTEQIDALRTLATHPVSYLVVPRITATIIALPILTAEAIAIGIGAAYVLSSTYLEVDPTYSWHWLVYYADVQGVSMGLIKATIYGVLIGLISCYKGMTCGEGAEGVGRATTEAVVFSDIAILISNFFLTLFLNRVMY